MRDRALWLSPPAFALVGMALVNLVWLGIFLAELAFGDPQYVFPKGLFEVVASKLTIGGRDLTVPAVTLYNLGLVLGALAPLLFSDVREWARAEGRSAASWVMTHRTATVRIVPFSIALALVFIPLSDVTRLPYTQERVRWATDWFPLPIPLDPPLLVRSEFLLTRVIDARYAFVLVSLAFHGLLAAYLIRAFGWRNAVPVALAYVAVVANWRSFYFLNGAEAELPAASFALMGLLAVLRGRYVPGVVLFFIALLFKPTALYYGAIALGIVAWRIARGRVAVGALPWSLATLCAAVVGSFWIGMLLNVTLLRGTGAGSFFTASGSSFLLTPLVTFITDLSTNYPAQLSLAVAGLIWPRSPRGALVGIAVAALLLRSTSPVAGGYYTTFFIPLMAYLGAGFVVRLWEIPGFGRRLALAVSVAALAVNAATYAALPNKEGWISRSNSGWEQLLDTLERDVPRGATVYFRKVSPRYDLERAGRRDLRFFELSEGEGQVATLSREGPVLYIAPYRDLRGADGPLAAIGYRELVPAFGSEDDPFVVLLKR